MDPGNPVFGIANTPKITSGCTDLCAKRCVALYERSVDTVVPAAGTKEAELAKLLENTYRNINIALVNEFALYCHAVGADVWNVVDCAATKPFGYQAFRPGPGIGGHCIPVDPEYLLHQAQGKGLGFELVRAAQRTHDAMPRHVVERAQTLLETTGTPVRGASVVLLGVTYKPDTDDHRQSPAAGIARGLTALGSRVSYHDPYVRDFTPAGTQLPPPAGRAGRRALRRPDDPPPRPPGVRPQGTRGHGPAPLRRDRPCTERPRHPALNGGHMRRPRSAGSGWGFEPKERNKGFDADGFPRLHASLHGRFVPLVCRGEGLCSAYLVSTRPSGSGPAVTASSAACQAESAGQSWVRR
ncbi:nucleotide sugar dehydrogenase [Streptomyces sp. CG1]|uniref:nucleotide sugar dehydrogenase n=1 Tax=Streptomyces sp. CG1 TaxID=1287523 RepID=UPI0034E2C292